MAPNQSSKRPQVEHSKCPPEKPYYGAYPGSGTKLLSESSTMCSVAVPAAWLQTAILGSLSIGTCCSKSCPSTGRIFATSSLTHLAATGRHRPYEHQRGTTPGYVAHNDSVARILHGYARNGTAGSGGDFWPHRFLAWSAPFWRVDPCRTVWVMHRHMFSNGTIGVFSSLTFQWTYGSYQSAMVTVAFVAPGVRAPVSFVTSVLRGVLC